MKKVGLLAIIASILVLNGCNNSQNINDEQNTSAVLNNNNIEMVGSGNTIKVDYVGKLQDGTVFDTSIESEAKAAGIYNEQRPYNPLEFIVGAGQLIRGFDSGVIGMKVGETKDISIDPDNGYGKVDESKMIKLFVGSGTQVGGYDVALDRIENGNAVLDFNMRLAGKTLIFDVILVENDGNDEAVTVGNTIKVDYVGKLQDGTIFDTSIESEAKNGGVYNPQRPYEPLEFTVGAGQMIKGFDAGVVGMKVGEKKSLTLSPDMAYGEKNKDYFMEYSKGAQITLLPGAPTVKEIGQDYVVLDLNHFLAGQNLLFTVTVKEIK